MTRLRTLRHAVLLPQGDAAAFGWAVLLCAAYYASGVLGLAAEPGEKQSAPLLRPTKGVHIVVDAARLPVRHAVVLQSPDDGRVLFAIPWYDPGPDGAPLGAGAPQKSLSAIAGNVASAPGERSGST